jgi:hypothetical protein
MIFLKLIRMGGCGGQGVVPKGGRGVVDKGDFSFLKKSLVTFVLSLRLLRHFVPRNDIFCYALFGKCDIVELLNTFNYVLRFTLYVLRYYISHDKLQIGCKEKINEHCTCYL